MLRKIILAAALLFAAPAYADDASDIAAAVNAYNDTLNKNDFPGAAAYYAPNPTMTSNEFTPHVWSGANAFSQWGADYGTYAQSRAMTEPSMALAKPAHVDATGDRGYAVFPATFSFKAKGAATHEDGYLTFAMQKIGGAWKIAGWSWTTK